MAPTTTTRRPSRQHAFLSLSCFPVFLTTSFALRRYPQLSCHGQERGRCGRAELRPRGMVFEKKAASIAVATDDERRGDCYEPEERRVAAAAHGTAGSAVRGRGEQMPRPHGRNEPPVCRDAGLLQRAHKAVAERCGGGEGAD